MATDDGTRTILERPASRPERARSEPAIVDEPAPERTFAGRYVPGAEIARGGMGRVLEATDTLLSRTVAVKEALSDDPDTMRRFAREVRITARLEHPAIVPVYDAGDDPSAPFYVMRRVSGRPLSKLMEEAHSLDERLALMPHVLAAAHAIAHAHKRGVLHRDIKPHNILVGEHGETVVIDWGIAKVIAEPDDDDVPAMPSDSLRTRIGTVAGSPGFMSPEQARGDALGPMSDVWALGATLHFVLANELPHERNARTPDDLVNLAGTRPVPPITEIVAGVPPELAAITARALAFDERERFADAGALADELSRFLTGQIVASHRYSRGERIRRWVRRNRAIVAIGAIAFVVVASVSTVAILRVLAARERADAAARVAEAARAQEAMHAQTELIARARAQATVHPTSALAALEQLPAGSPLGAQADAIVATAVSHGGAAWALGGNTGATGHLEMNRAGTLALIVANKQLRVWDLQTRALLVERETTINDYATFVGSRVLLYGPKQPPRYLDPRTGAITPLGTTPVHSVMVAADDTHAAVDIGRDVGWLDLQTGEVTRVHGPASLATMPDAGGWLVTQNDQDVRVFDRSGAQIAERTGEMTWASASRADHLALVVDGKIFELEVTATPTWLERPRSDIIWVEYFGERMLGRSAGTLYTHNRANQPVAMTTFNGLSLPMQPCGDGMCMFKAGLNPREMLYVDGLRPRTIPLPEAITGARLSGRAGVPRVLIASTSRVFVLELAHVVPRRRPELGELARASLIGEDTTVAMARNGRWQLFRGTVAEALAVPEHAVLFATSPDQRVLFSNVPVRFDGISLVDVGRMQIWNTKADAAKLVAGGALVTIGRELHLRRDGEDQSTKLTTLAGDDVWMSSVGETFHVFSGGEHLRGTLTAGVTSRTPFRMFETGALTVYGERVLISEDTTVHWDALDGPLAATFDTRVASLTRARGGVVAVLASGVVMFIEITASGVTTHQLASAPGVLGDHGDRIIVPSLDGTDVIELPSRQRWTHPIAIARMHAVSMSPDGRRLLEQASDNSWWEWTLPGTTTDGPDVRELRERATNAREQDDRVLLWP